MNISKVEIMPYDSYFNQRAQLKEFEELDTFEDALDYFKENIILRITFKDILGSDFLNVYNLWTGSMVTPTGKYIAYIMDYMSATHITFYSPGNYCRGTFNNLQEFLSKMYLTYSEYKAITSGKLTTSVEGLKVAAQLTDWLTGML